MPQQVTAEIRPGEGTHLWLLVMKTFHAISAHAKADLMRNGLGLSDFAILEVLLHKGPLPVNAIGPKVHLTPGSISTAVERLHARRLVSRVEDAEDRRVRTVRLLPKGRTLAEAVFNKHQAAIDRISGGLSRHEAAQLATLLKKLGKYAKALSC